MKKFVFRLENILNFRKKIEDGAQREFSKRKADLLKVENEMETVRGNLKAFIRENPYKEGTFTVSEIVAVDNYISRTHGTIEQLAGRIIAKEDEVYKALGVLVEAKKERKVIENLKQRKFERYTDDLNRAENDELDDINQKIGLNREKLTIEDVPLEEM